MIRPFIHATGRALGLALAAAIALGAAPASADFYAGVLAAQAEDYETAFKEWLPLAEGGLSGAQSNIGELYANGLGVEENFAEAARWHLLAAGQGVLKSIFYIGAALAGGKGVEKDMVEAVKWLLLAKRAGFPNADRILSIISQSVSAEDAAEGERLADEWVPAPGD